VEEEARLQGRSSVGEQRGRRKAEQRREMGTAGEENAGREQRWDFSTSWSSAGDKVEGDERVGDQQSAVGGKIQEKKISTAAAFFLATRRQGGDKDRAGRSCFSFSYFSQFPFFSFLGNRRYFYNHDF
jgi:hypothetical protein